MSIEIGEGSGAVGHRESVSGGQAASGQGVCMFYYHSQLMWPRADCETGGA